MRACSPSTGRQDAQQARLLTLKRAGMAAATVFVTANIWTGCPLLAVWIGSQAVGTKELSMGAVFIVVIAVALAATSLRILNEYERGVVFRLGRIIGAAPGGERVEDDLTAIEAEASPRLCGPVALQSKSLWTLLREVLYCPFEGSLDTARMTKVVSHPIGRVDGPVLLTVEAYGGCSFGPMTFVPVFLGFDS